MVTSMLLMHRASRSDRLVVGLARVLRQPLADPFVAEVVCVPTRGVERWLTQQLSGALGARPGHSDGVCANVAFPFPGAVVGSALAAASGIDPASDPWLPSRAVWPLLEVVDDSLGEPWLGQLAAHIAGSGEHGDTHSRRFSAVRHLADLFDRYAVHRPSLIEAWAGLSEPCSAGAAEPETAWQRELWCRLREYIASPSPAERLVGACEKLRSDPSIVELPERFSLFGLTRLPASYLRLLVALSQEREVHLWLLHPSAALWERVATCALGVSTGREAAQSRADYGQSVALLARNPLLRSWGRDAIEMQMVAAAAGAAGGESLDSSVEAEPDHSGEGFAQTLLERIQAQVRCDAEPPGMDLPAGIYPAGLTEDVEDARPLLDSDDHSIEIHSCHGRARQVEVLRDVIAHLLVEAPTLEPRDVIVMCPDIEAFAPLIQATFSQAGLVIGTDLGVRLADRSLRQTNAVLATLARLLEMAGGRVTASDLLDLAGTAPVRARFGFDDGELTRIERWVRASGVRWGLDRAWRDPYGLGKLHYATWASGLDRILTGVAVSEHPPSWAGGVLPLDGVDSGDIDLVGRLVELVDRAGVALRSLSKRQSLSAWIGAMAGAADMLFDAPPAEQWQVVQLHRLLEELLGEARTTPAGPTTPLCQAELRALLADRLRGAPTRANFCTGHITMCSLVPMRSVPHRVVCLLGLDDGAFPRRISPDSDDILATDPWIGDPDSRSEDLQLLLDAVMAAEERLVIIYSGRDEHSNSRRPPAVPVAELVCLAERTVRSDGGPLRDRLVTEHPLQPFDQRNFEIGALRAGRSWSFDRAALAGAKAFSGDSRQASPVLRPSSPFAETLPPLQTQLVSLEDLVSFVQHPVKAFLRQRLGIFPRPRPERPADAITVEMDALGKWQVGDRLVRSCLEGVPLEVAVRAEQSRQYLPPGALGARVLEEIAVCVEALLVASRTTIPLPRSLEVSVTLGSGITVAGTVGDVFGPELRNVTYSRLAPKHRLRAWVVLLALSAAEPEVPWRARSVGRCSKGRSATVARLVPIGADPIERRALASRELQIIVELYLKGMCEPLPLAERTSAAWAVAERAGLSPEAAARGQWESSFDQKGEDDDAAHRVAHGGALGWDGFVSAIPLPGEEGPGWGSHPSRAGRLATRLWQGLLEAEEMR